MSNLLLCNSDMISVGELLEWTLYVLRRTYSVKWTENAAVLQRCVALVYDKLRQTIVNV